MDGRRKPRISESFTAETFDGELLLYCETGEEAFYLNDTARAVLQLCSEDLTVDQIIELLQQHYPDQAEEIPGHVVEVLSALASNGVIVYQDE